MIVRRSMGLASNLRPRARRTRRERLAALITELPDPPGDHRAISVIRWGQRDDGSAALPSEVEIIHVPHPSGSALRAAAASAHGELLCFLGPGMQPLEAGWLHRLAAGLQHPVVAAAPARLHPERPRWEATPYDLHIRELGLAVDGDEEGVPLVRSRDAGLPPSIARGPERVDAASGDCLVVSADAYRRAGGHLDLADPVAAGVELCLRLRSQGGEVIAVPDALVLDHRPVRDPEALERPLDPRDPAWGEVLASAAPLLRAGRPGQMAITVAAPSSRTAQRWGDGILAEALARSLRRRGHPVLVGSLEQLEDPTLRCAEVHLVLRGKKRIPRVPGPRHVLWIISHPDTVSVEECDEADLVLVASDLLAEHLRSRTATPVVTMLQATDHRIFRPLPPDPAYAHPVAIVANARRTMRPVVADALAVGLRPALYGRGWLGRVDPRLLRGRHVRPELLPALYSSVGVLLADHWPDMRRWGFVSNRIFDTLACGTPLICDEVPGLRELIGDAVTTYGTPEELLSAVARTLDDDRDARRRALAGRDTVLAHHTFDHRADQLLDLLAQRLG